MLAGGTVAAPESDDPFADLEARSTPAESGIPSSSLWTDNFLFRRELNIHVNAPSDNSERDPGFRGSIGFEVQKKFSTPTSTLAALDVQGRLVWRDGWRPTLSDPMGRDAEGWTYETHNATLDLFDLIGPPGAVNARLGHGYVPFGLNAITDSHAYLFQPQADENFGFERDTQALLWGSPSDFWDASLGALAGRGEPFTLDSSTGLGVARMGLGRWFRQEHGVEGGFSFLGGVRKPPHAHTGSVSAEAGEEPAGHEDPVMDSDAGDSRIRTWRIGADGRWAFTRRGGVWVLSAEASGGGDDGRHVRAGLAQAEWIHSSGFWSAMAQGRVRRAPAGDSTPENSWAGQLVITRHLEMDPTRSRLHFIAAGVECRGPASGESGDVLWMAQYYRFW